MAASSKGVSVEKASWELYKFMTDLAPGPNNSFVVKELDLVLFNAEVIFPMFRQKTKLSATKTKQLRYFVKRDLAKYVCHDKGSRSGIITAIQAYNFGPESRAVDTVLKVFEQKGAKTLKIPQVFKALSGSTTRMSRIKTEKAMSCFVAIHPTTFTRRGDDITVVSFRRGDDGAPKVPETPPRAHPVDEGKPVANCVKSLLTSCIPTAENSVFWVGGPHAGKVFFKITWIREKLPRDLRSAHCASTNALSRFLQSNPSFVVQYRVVHCADILQKMATATDVFNSLSVRMGTTKELKFSEAFDALPDGARHLVRNHAGLQRLMNAFPQQPFKMTSPGVISLSSDVAMPVSPEKPRVVDDNKTSIALPAGLAEPPASNAGAITVSEKGPAKGQPRSILTTGKVVQIVSEAFALIYSFRLHKKVLFHYSSNGMSLSDDQLKRVFHPSGEMLTVSCVDMSQEVAEVSVVATDVVFQTSKEQLPKAVCLHAEDVFLQWQSFVESRGFALMRIEYSPHFSIAGARRRKLANLVTSYGTTQREDLESAMTWLDDLPESLETTLKLLLPPYPDVGKDESFHSIFFPPIGSAKVRLERSLNPYVLKISGLDAIIVNVKLSVMDVLIWLNVETHFIVRCSPPSDFNVDVWDGVELSISVMMYADDVVIIEEVELSPRRKTSGEEKAVSQYGTLLLDVFSPGATTTDLCDDF